MKRNRLAVSFLGRAVSSPLVLPAGVMGVSFSGLLSAARNGASIVTTKSYTLQPRPGHQGPVVAQVSSGLLNSMGLCNPGLEAGLREIEELRTFSSVPVIISLFDTTAEGFARLAGMIPEGAGDFIELNLSCPNVRDEFGTPLASSPALVRGIVESVKSRTGIPVIAKLSPNVNDITSVAVAAEEGGADALSLINTVGPGMGIDVRTGKPILGPLFGGLSGPCIKPVAIRAVYEVTRKTAIPVIGMGGVTTGEDMLEMVMAGASMVGVGTAAAIRGIGVFERIREEAEALMERYGYESLERIRGGIK